MFLSNKPMMAYTAFPQTIAYAGQIPGQVTGPVAVSGYAAPGMAETIHAAHTEAGPVCGPGHVGHSELDVDIHPAMAHRIYVVRPGDTVYKIAQMYGLDWRELAGYNHLGNPDWIYPGERLFIPPRF